MRIRQLGESCLIMEELPCLPAELAHRISSDPPPGLLEAVPAFDQLALYFDPDVTNPKVLLALPDIPEENSMRHSDESQNPPESKAKLGKTPFPSLGRGEVEKSRKHTIPALYSAPDLTEVAQALNLTVKQLIQLHSQATYTVEAIGFCPGFPYLSGLPIELQNLPRRPNPRIKVESGTIAITGDQCCIYPLERPGGWNLIARTPYTIVNPETDYFPLQVGDTIQFQPIDQSQFNQLVGNNQ